MIEINQLCAELHQKQQLTIEHLNIHAGESWAFIGGNGSGKSAFSELFKQGLNIVDGQISGLTTPRWPLSASANNST